MQFYGFDAFQIAGLFGVAFYLGSYAALQIGVLKDQVTFTPQLTGQRQLSF